jgi:hypothetical protein
MPDPTHVHGAAESSNCLRLAGLIDALAASRGHARAPCPLLCPAVTVSQRKGTSDAAVVLIMQLPSHRLLSCLTAYLAIACAAAQDDLDEPRGRAEEEQGQLASSEAQALTIRYSTSASAAAPLRAAYRPPATTSVVPKEYPRLSVLGWSTPITEHTLGIPPDPMVLGKTLEDIVSSRVQGSILGLCSDCHHETSEYPYHPRIAQGATSTIYGYQLHHYLGDVWLRWCGGYNDSYGSSWATWFRSRANKPVGLKDVFAKWMLDGCLD